MRTSLQSRVRRPSPLFYAHTQMPAHTRVCSGLAFPVAADSLPTRPAPSLGFSCVFFPASAVLGENMPAEAVPGRWLQAPKGVVQGPLPKETRHVRLNFGIIDILQGYNLSKQVEHSWKSIVQGQENISAVNPVEYSRRFQARACSGSARLPAATAACLQAWPIAECVAACSVDAIWSAALTFSSPSQEFMAHVFKPPAPGSQ